MDDLNVIKTINNSTCTIYVCNNEIGTKEEQEQCWQEFCKIAYKILNERRNPK